MNTKALSTSIAIALVLLRLTANALIVWAIAVAFANNGICLRTVLALALWFVIREMDWAGLVKWTKKLKKYLDDHTRVNESAETDI